MYAKVLDVNDHLIYLEIDRQLRFKSRYVLDTSDNVIKREARVEFDFSMDNGYPFVVIHTGKVSPFRGAQA
jgi:hypothetical protein